MKKILLLTVVILVSCTQTVPQIATATVSPPKPTVTHTTTHLATQPSTTLTPQAVPVPVVTKTPLPVIEPDFDRQHPFRFGTEENFVDFSDLKTNDSGETYSDPNYTTMITSFSASLLFPELHKGGDLLEQLGKCDGKAVSTNGYDGLKLVLYKIIMFFHSGIACGEDNPANFLRVFLEGKFSNWPELDKRAEKIAELIGQSICFKQSTGDACFTVVDIAVVPEKRWFLEKYVDTQGAERWVDTCKVLASDTSEEGKRRYTQCRQRVSGSPYRFFETGSLPGVREMFLVFCSVETDEEGLRHKIIIRLTPVTDGSKP